MEFNLQSGAKLIVTASSFKEAQALNKALLASIKGLDIADNIMNTDVKSFFSAIVSAATSDDVERALFKCAERSSYDGVKVTPALFDDIKLAEQAREDYYEICKCIIEVNCSPFFKGVFSWFRASSTKTTGNIPASK